MSIAHSSLKGNTFYDAYRAYNGLTLIAPAEGIGPLLIDMHGHAVHRWETDNSPAGYIELLPNGHILYSGKTEDNPLFDIDGAGGVLLEMDWSGKVVWEFRDCHLHDGCFRTESGNTLIIKWRRIPKDIAAQVQGGEGGSPRDGVMWGDEIQEITPEKKVVWSWIAHEHLDPETDISCPLCPRVEWTHAVSCLELRDGNILVCFRKNDSIVIFKRETGEILWRWGKGELSHPQQASVLDNGNILIFDSGYHHAGINMANSRIVEVVPYTGQIVWSYAEGASQLFYSSGLSNAQRLPNGNTLVCEGVCGRLFEVTPEGFPVWEYINQLSGTTSPISVARHLPIYAARRYGVDYSGLLGRAPSSYERQSAPGTSVEADQGIVPEQKDDGNKVLERLQQLGY